MAVLWTLVALPAGARPTRPRFEPTDLELEDPGVTELDLQVGVTRGQGEGGNRLLAPDFELDVGLAPNVELDLDGAFSENNFDRPTRSFAGEALWAAMKLGLYDSHGGPGMPNIALGLQLGPRLPTIGARGIGYAALGLLGVHERALTVVLNAGGIVDPGDHVTSGQSKSVVSGIDVEVDLDAKGIWSGLVELAGARFLSSEPDELAISAGFGWSVTPNLDLSTVALAGLLPGGDRLGLLFGASPKTRLW